MPQKWMTLKELRRYFPDIYERWEREGKFPKLRIQYADGSIAEYIGNDWMHVSSYNIMKSIVVCDKDGNPLFVCPAIWERTGVTTIAWGRDRDTNEVHVGIIYQPRPGVDQPPDPNSDQNLVPGTDEYMKALYEKRFEPQVILAQTPAGLKDIDPRTGKLASRDATARSEASEESGAGDDAILSITYPNAPFWNSWPGFGGGWHYIAFVEVDLEKIRDPRPDTTEPIYKATFMPIAQLFEHIAQGSVPVLIDGEEQIVQYRAGTSLAVLAIFFANYLTGRLGK